MAKSSAHSAISAGNPSAGIIYRSLHRARTDAEKVQRIVDLLNLLKKG